MTLYCANWMLRKPLSDYPPEGKARSIKTGSCINCTDSPKDYALRTTKTKKILSDLLQNIDEGDEVNEVSADICQ